MRITGWLLLAAAALFLVAYAVPILDPGMSPGARRFWMAVTVVTWVVFVADYLIRLARAGDRRDFVRHHLLDLAILVLPMLRPLTLVRLLRAVGLRFGARALVSAGVATLLLGITAALAVLKAERTAPGATITSFGEAVWWTVTTVTTVGYGDTYPVTPYGRVVAAGLMFGGIALLGVVTATFSGWFVQRFQDPDDTADRLLLEETLAELRAVRAQLGKDPD